MRHYETIYIIKPTLSEKEHKEIIKKVNDLIEDQKGVIIRTEEWGKQKLAYEIEKFDHGSYILINYCSPQEMIIALAKVFKIHDGILKHQTVKLDDKADPQELLQKEKETQTTQKETAEEAPNADESTAPPAEETNQANEVKNGD